MKTKHIAILALAFALVTIGCGSEDQARKQQLVQQGFSEEGAGKLSELKLSDEEVQQLGEAKRGGLDEAAASDMVKSMHDRDLKFDLGSEMPIMIGQGIGTTALTQLVDMGAIPRWTDDIRAMKDAGVSDVTIVEIAKLRFKENKDILSGSQYGELKQVRVSDAGVLDFARKGGTEKQLQDLILAIRLGKSEQEAMKEVGL